MIGLAYLAAGAVYLAVTVWLVTWAARAAKRRGIAGWKWGLPVALVMYLLVFWDWIPTVVAHKYYCSKYAGFTVYKTLNEWKQENPGVAETLVPLADSLELMPKEPIRQGIVTRINERFNRIHRKQEVARILPVDKLSTEIVDAQTGARLAEAIDYRTGYGNPMVSANWRSIKFWLNNNSCFSNNKRATESGLMDFTESIIEPGH